MNIKFIKNTITALITSVVLCHVLIKTNDLLTRIIVIPFLIFGISLFMKNICLVFKKDRIARKFSIINAVSLFVYYFGFLVFWDYTAITNKDYKLIAVSLLLWVGGIFVAYKSYLRLRK